jgi:hypothetical protein
MTSCFVRRFPDFFPDMLACLANAPWSAEAQAQSERPVREHHRLSIGLCMAWVIPPPPYRVSSLRLSTATSGQPAVAKQRTLSGPALDLVRTGVIA